MNNILQWIIDLPYVVFPVMEEVYRVFTSPINNVLDVFLNSLQGMGPPFTTIFGPLLALIEGLLTFLNAIGTNITLIDLIIGGMLPAIILITLVKWIIGIVT